MRPSPPAVGPGYKRGGTDNGNSNRSGRDTREEEQTTGYVLHRGCPLAVRVSRAGNLVDATGGDGQGPVGGVFCRRAAESGRWPTIYATQDEAGAAIAAREASCEHKWRPISHEERGCHKCGAVEFVPDI